MKLDSSRSLETQQAYDTYKATHPDDWCDFCHIEQSASQIIKEYEFFRIVTNAFPYNVWDRGHVVTHIMLVPKRHIESISHFTPEEQAEFMQLLEQYEADGYNFYGRALGSSFKSIAHQHTHLMVIEEPQEPLINY